MEITEADLEAKRQRANELRSEIRSIQADTANAHAEAEKELASRQLDAEITRLERERDLAVEYQQGSVEAALALMDQVATATDPTGAALQAQTSSMDRVEPEPATPTESEKAPATVEAVKAEEKAATAKMEAAAPAATKTGGNK